jgi:UDP-3-O-[3-hydroxymyristoyl] glucosamine N-acyltransferase
MSRPEDLDPLSVAVIAQRLGGTVEGDPDRLISAVATLDRAGPDDISWAGSAAFLQKASRSLAGAIVAPLDGTVSGSAAVIRVADPDLAMVRVQGWLAPPAHELPAGVHPTAVVGEGSATQGASIGPHVSVGRNVTIGEGTEIHAGARIGDSATIGRDCVIAPNVVVGERVRIGDRVIIHANTTLGAHGFGFLFREGKHVKIPQTGTVEIGNDVEIGANNTIDRARTGVTRIGDGVKTDNQVHVGHNVVVGDHSMLIAMTAVGGSTVLGHHVIISGHCGITDHVTIGNGVRCGAFSMITNDVPDGAVLKGDPATDLRTEQRNRAAGRRLPRMREKLRDLEARIRELESDMRDGLATGES